jgi:hypothetical protein
MRQSNVLGSTTEEGESPVDEVNYCLLSRAGPEKSCLNTAAPSAKAEYYWKTDSEPVP